MNLRLDLMGMNLSGELRHAQIVMDELRIHYEHATPQSICDQWWFWNCTNVPEHMPSYLSELKMAPHESIGNGLSKEDADRLASSTSEQL